MANTFQYVTYLQARQALSLRLNDVAQVCWTDAEVGLYLCEALRTYNCLTQTWLFDFVATYTSVSLPWQSTANSLNALVGPNPSSPRTQTLNDSYVYTLAQYHLLEPPNGNGTWAGTPQFSLADFTQALQRRRDAVLQETACNIGPFSNSFGITPGTNSVQLPDSPSQSILDLRRVRFVPATGLGSASTLYREDGMAFEYFNNAFEQNSGTPLSWDVLAGPEQFITVDALVNVPNTLDILAMISGGIIVPPANSPLLIPDDFYWVLKFGMMADLLNKESESTDPQRAAYCEQRYQEGLKLMVEMPWLTQARINNVPVDTPSVAEMDTFDYEWQSNAAAQRAIVRGGIDLFALSPKPTGNTSVNLTLVGNAPVPVVDADFVQVSRDVFDSILDYAQHLAAFKLGGAEFLATVPLYQSFIDAAMSTNKRLRMSGIFETTLYPPNSRQSEAQPRFAEGASNAV